LKIRVRQDVLFLTAGAIIIAFAGGFSLRAESLAEAIDATNLVWTTGGDAVWFAETTNTYDGVDAVQSGAVQSNQTSWLQTTVVGPATISFWNVTKLSSPGFPEFNWNFTINGTRQGMGMTSQWSEQIYDLGEGTNVLRWTAFIWPGGTATGFVCLDEFTVSPPRPLAIVYQPLDWTVYSGAPVWLSVSAVGTPPIQYQWLKDNTNISNATNSWLNFNQTTTNDTGTYSVVVSNSQGSVVSSNALLTVLPPSPPFFTSEPESTAAYTGQDFEWWAAVDGSPPFTYQWLKDGTNIPNAAANFLDLNNISPTDAGTYSLWVTNDYGCVESTDAVLTVVQSVPPVITHQPRSLEVAAGVNTWMSVDAIGVPGPWYIWAKEGSPPAPSDPFPAPPISLSNPQRIFYNVTTNDAGVYFATVTNYAGSVASQDALLTVLPAITTLGSWDQDAVDIFVTNGLAFLARGTNGLAILDVSHPASPQLIGSYRTPGYASVVRVSGSLAFVVDNTAGLQILSVTNPANPVLVGGYNLSGIGDIAVRSNLVYVADGIAGLMILNVSNPATPSMAGRYVTNIGAVYICLAGNDAIFSSPITWIGLGTNRTILAGLVVVDVSNPAHPFEVGRLSLAIGHVTCLGQSVFGTTWNGFQSLQIITITNPAQPAVIGTFDYYPSTNTGPSLGVSASDVRVVNDLAFAVGNSGGQSQLYVLDVRDPTEPIPVGHYTDATQPTALAVDGDQVYFSGSGSPLEIVGTPFNTNLVVAPVLSVSAQSGLNLFIQGRRGLHYDVEYADQLTGAPWQTLQTILLTNDSAVIEVPSGPVARFFRLKQLD
jgi:hypothetical protein